MDIIQVHLLNFLPKTMIGLLIMYFVFKSLDMLLGILKSWKNDNYESDKMRSGIIRWIAELLGIIFVVCIDLFIGLDFYLCGFMLSLFIYKEGISIKENLEQCGVVIPKAVDDQLENFNKEK